MHHPYRSIQLIKTEKKTLSSRFKYFIAWILDGDNQWSRKILGGHWHSSFLDPGNFYQIKKEDCFRLKHPVDRIHALLEPGCEDWGVQNKKIKITNSCA